MFSDEILTGWICTTSYFSNFQESPGSFPAPIGLALIAKGWAEEIPSESFDGVSGLKLTDAGEARADLYAEDWGIELCFDEEESD